VTDSVHATLPLHWSADLAPRYTTHKVYLPPSVQYVTWPSVAGVCQQSPLLSSRVILTPPLPHIRVPPYVQYVTRPFVAGDHVKLINQEGVEVEVRQCKCQRHSRCCRYRALPPPVLMWQMCSCCGGLGA
jgi:hypothetical protein